MSVVHIREFAGTPDQYAAVAAVSTAVFPEYPMSPDALRYEEDHFDRTRYVLRRYVAEVAGRIVGHGVYHHMPYRFHPGRFWMWVEVHPAHQRQGIGALLYDRILADLLGLGAVVINTSARETMPGSIVFLDKRGFREVMRSWESHLDVQSFDFAPFQEYTKRMDREGITITTLAEEKERDPKWLEKAYDLHTTVMADVPAHTPYTPPPMDEFVRNLIEHPNTLLDGYFVAKDGDRYIGESFLSRNKEEPDHLYQGLTGVRREYRGRGVAMALKLKTIKYARDHGYTMIKTWNATTNERMLAINARLGFVRQPAWIEFEKSLAGT